MSLRREFFLLFVVAIASWSFLTFVIPFPYGRDGITLWRPLGIRSTDEAFMSLAAFVLGVPAAVMAIRRLRGL